MSGWTEYDPEALNDDNKMPFGKHKNERLGDIPDHYWRWFREQDWANSWPKLLAYARLVD